MQIYLPLWLHRTQETENNYRRERSQVFLPTFGFFQVGFQRSFCSWSQMEHQASGAQPTCLCCPSVFSCLCSSTGEAGVTEQCVLHSRTDGWKCTMDPGSWEAPAEHQVSSTSRTHGTYLAHRTLQNQFILKGSISFIIVVLPCGESQETWDLPSTKV